MIIHLSYLQTFYPGNFLRNLALHHSTTKYVFLCDVDLIPGYNTHEIVKGHINRQSFNQTQVSDLKCFQTNESTNKNSSSNDDNNDLLL